MNKKSQNTTRFGWKGVFSLLVVLVIALGAQGSFFLPAAQAHPAAAPLVQTAATNTITLSVISARTEPDAPGGPVAKGDPIATYDFLISVDNTGDPFNEEGCSPYLADGETRDPTYPDNCNLPSLRTVPGWAPVFTQGDETMLSTTASLDLPDGKYLISVQSDGFKMDGEHFTIPDEDGIVEVQMHPFPLPPATMVIQVFNDVEMTNGQFDVPSEVFDPLLPVTGPTGTNYQMSGFRASINDIAGEITTDIFGNPLCTVYQKDPDTGEVVLDADGAPVIDILGQGCYSDEAGIITIYNIGPLRYDVLIFPPAGEPWIQTTTLEGSQGWDTWLQEAGTGLDNEFLIAAEPAPWTMFGFVKPNAVDLGGTGSISGVIMAASTFVPAKDGLPYIGDTFGGFAGTVLHRPIPNPWLALSDLQAGDVAVWVGQGNADGSFNITGVPAGNYVLTYWDEKQHYILDLVQVTVNDGLVTDLGIRMLTGWFTEISGTVFLDTNENGRRDDPVAEPGLSDYLVVFKDRDNTEIDRMSIAAVTDPAGFYELEKGYPMGSWMVLEAYSDLYRTTGVTYQTLNMPEEVTLVEGLVDLGILPVLGQPIRVDWGVKPYGPTENGGIAGTVFYDTMRAEDDARYAGAEPFQPGIPDMVLNLYAAQLDLYGQPVLAADGSYAKGQMLATTLTETFERPTGCIARDAEGVPIDFPPIAPAVFNQDCVEGPMMGTQAGNGQNNLDGNWGFGDGCFGLGGYDPALDPDGTGVCADGTDPTPLTPGKYLVEAVVPDDTFGNPLYQVTREEDLNMFDGDEFVPAIPPPACAGALHTVDIAGSGIDNYPVVDLFEDGSVIVPASTPVDNPGYVDAGGSRYEGVPMPLCDVKYIELSNGKAVAPIFNFFTNVPIPGKWKGYIIDNLNVSVDPTTLFFGEMAGVPNVPIGLYDFNGRLVETVHSDFNGVYEVLLPSTGTFNAPSPSGMFANVYYLYGNDPGPIGAPNAYYNPQYRSIGTSFEIYPGNIMPSDLAPTQNGAAVWSPTSQYDRLALCKLNDADPATPDAPELFAVDKPYGSAGEAITIQGIGFGASGVVRLGGQPVGVTSWGAEEIVFTVPGAGTLLPGAHQLQVEAENGLTTVNSLTFHVRGGSYQPDVYEVGPGRTYDPAVYDAAAGGPGPIQAAIDAAWAAGGEALVVVYPGLKVPMINTQGMYIENPVLYAPVKLQGVGPGGILSDGTGVDGSIIDGRGVGGDSPYNLWWRETFLFDVWFNRGGWDLAVVEADGNPLVHEGAVITILAEADEFNQGFDAAIDGFILQGGDQQGFPNNPMTPIQEGGPIVVQGGGIFANGYAQNLQVSNNLIQTNGGSYGGAIRLGTAHLPDDPLTAEDESSNHNENTVIAHNRILANGGTNLAGAIALFNGSDGYEIAYNDICGNSSIEYGGGISHYGYSPGGEIHHNRIYFNSSYDEGGGIMIAGELPSTPVLSEGAGAVDIHHNLVQSNLANDDGGGLRFLMAGVETYNVFNNFFVNNVSTHEGGGVSLNDAPYVNLFNNTIMKNVTTATALTSTGLPAPAGLASSANSTFLQAVLPVGADIFSNPVQFNNVFWDNRAGYWDGNAVSGIGLPGDLGAIYYWDLGVADGSGLLEPQYSLLQNPYGADPTNIIGEDPLVVGAYDTTVRILPWRGNFNFVGINIVAVDAPISLQGDYHLMAGSPAIDYGTELGAPADDYDGDPRPQNCGVEMGADEVVMPDPLLYFSTVGNTPIPGLFIPVDDADIYAWDGAAYWCVFDASKAGLPNNAQLNGLVVEDRDTFYMNFRPSLSLPGMTQNLTPLDVARYDAGNWSLAFDGADAGLSTAIDAFEILNANSILISGDGNVNVLPGQPARDEDLVQCTGTFGPNTTCSWSMYFDGSDVGLTENVNGASVAGSDIHLTTVNPISIGGLLPGSEDVFTCNSATTGPNTACASYSLYFDGSANGILDRLTAIDVPPAPASALAGVQLWTDTPRVYLPLVVSR